MCCAVAIVGLGVAFVLRKNPFSTWRKVSFATFVGATFIAIGMAVCINSTPSNELPPITPHTMAIARVESTPAEQEYTYRTQATIVALNDSNTLQDVNIKTQIYLQKSYTKNQTWNFPTELK